jgi:TonB dependent receptor/TonB-dependent Receptor Plug Domain
MKHLLIASGIIFYSNNVVAQNQYDDAFMATATGNVSTVIGGFDSASEGVVSSSQIESQGQLRPADVLEFIPGVAVTQHSGDGKANQYFLRGFNLDHGTDFSIYIEGMPVNLPSNAHGQGYTDLNFLIPEIIGQIDYRKGPYYADVGDFSSAGSANIYYKNNLENSFGLASVGSYNYKRLLSAGSTEMNESGNLMGALEVLRNDGPWENPEGVKKLNGLLKYSDRLGADKVSLLAMGYSNSWNSTDQIPLGAITSGIVNRYGAIDPTDGGSTSRYSLSGSWHRDLNDGYAEASLYYFRYQLQLFSNFTYYLNDPINGDQFRQMDNRNTYGGMAQRVWLGNIAGLPMSNTLGYQLRQDRITVGLNNTRQRQVLEVVRNDDVLQTSNSMFAENDIAWQPWLHSKLGGRYDRYNFNVASNIPINSGVNETGMFSPKATITIGPFEKTKFYLNYGQGFHSNDARGVTIKVDPNNIAVPVDSVPGLVKTTGYEFGISTQAIQYLESSLAFWQLNIGSELVFQGDAGITEPNRPSQRKGVEWTNHFTPFSWFSLDGNFTYSQAKYVDSDPLGSFVPGAVGLTGSVMADVRRGPWSGGIQWRYIGPSPLVEDGSVYSNSSSVFNGRVKYEFTPKVNVTLDIFNIFNQQSNDISYYYQSRAAPNLPATTDVTIHPAEPRSYRATLTYNF